MRRPLSVKAYDRELVAEVLSMCACNRSVSGYDVAEEYGLPFSIGAYAMRAFYFVMLSRNDDWNKGLHKLKRGDQGARIGILLIEMYAEAEALVRDGWCPITESY